MKDALLVVDVFNDFQHEDGDALFASFTERVPAMIDAIAAARDAGIPVVYVNDQHGRWHADAPALVRDALADPRRAELLAALAPKAHDPFVLKPRYSVFNHTAVELLLRELEVERILLVGAATEGCIVQSGIDARELGFKVTILAAACATNDVELEELALHYAGRVGGMRVEHGSGGGSSDPPPFGQSSAGSSSARMR
jgi:nicotinamidase-related amidase